MNKSVNIRLIKRMSWYYPEYTPICVLTTPGFFFVLGAKFENFQKWPETTEIRKVDFENAFAGKVDVQNTYIEVYSNEASYYMCHIYLGPIIVWYYIMTIKKEIILIFYRFVHT